MSNTWMFGNGAKSPGSSPTATTPTAPVTTAVVPDSKLPVYTLTRTQSDAIHTAGQLTGPLLDRSIFTIEREWNNNRIGDSCVPPGSYLVERYMAPSFGSCWILSNRSLGVAKFPEPGIPRSAILIHSANFAFQLRGCIAPGATYGKMVYTGNNSALSRFRNKAWPAVTSSVPTMEYLRRQLPNKFTLIIR